MKEKERAQEREKPALLKDLVMSFSLDMKSGVPFYRQIIQMVEHNIAIGRLKAGDRLPTIRALAITLKINPNTIAKAYMELEIRGLVQTQVGSGTFISSKKVDLEEERARTKKMIEELCMALVQKALAHGVSREELIKVIKEIKIDEEGKHETRHR